jgi:hypothetical protein
MLPEGFVFKNKWRVVRLSILVLLVMLTTVGFESRLPNWDKEASVEFYIFITPSFACSS